VSRIADYMDRWLENTPVIQPEVEAEYIPPYPKEPELGKKVTKFKLEGDTFVEVPTIENLLKR